MKSRCSACTQTNHGQRGQKILREHRKGMRKGRLFSLLLPLLLLTMLQGCSKKEAYRLAVLQWSEKVPVYQNAFDGFMITMRAKGYMEGKNLEVRRFSCSQNREKARSLTEKLAQWQPNLFLALGTPAALAAKEVLQKGHPDIPLVFTATTAPDKTGIIPSYAPQKSIVGVGVEIPAEDRVRVIKETFYQAKRVGIIYFPDTRPAVLTSKDAAKAFKAVGIEPLTLSLNSKDKNGGLKKIDALAKKVDLLYFSPDPILYASPFVEKALGEAMKNKVPVAGITKSIVAKGAVIAEYVDYYQAGEEAADMAFKILEGVSPQKLRSHPSQSRHIAVNLSSARRLDITIPRTILLRANEIIDVSGSK